MLDGLVMTTMSDEFLDHVMELNVLLSIIAMISVVYVVFIWIPLS